MNTVISNGNQNLAMMIMRNGELLQLPIIGWHFDLGLPTPVTMEDIADDSLFAVIDTSTNNWWVDNGGITGSDMESLADVFASYVNTGEAA